MDSTDLQKACMADLGRQRQDELPLSDREGKRPSYEPGRRNGTAHYAPSLRKGLESSTVHIQDEESADMQGLAIGDSRPWAKITETYMNRHHADTAPPLIRRESQGPKRLKSVYPTDDEAMGEFGGLVPPGGIVVRLPPPAQQPHNLPEREPETKPERIIESTPTKTTLPMKPKPLVSEQVVYRGLCKLLDAGTKKPLFVVTCALKIQKNSDKALIQLSAANKEDKSHNVLEISAPEIEGDCCRLCSRVMDSNFRYILQFSNVSEAKEFGLYLESLQKAAARALGAVNPGSQPTGTDVPASFKLPTSNKECITTQKTSQNEAKLVDVESPSTPKQGTKVPTIEDAAQMLFDLIEKILPEAAAAGLNVSEDAVSDIQETAIDSWLTRGFLKSETDDMRSELLDLLRILVRIKRKAESRKQAAQPKPVIQSVIQSLKDFERADAKPHCIKYSVSEIQKLSSCSAPTPAGLNQSIVTPLRTQAARNYSSAAAVADMSKHKAWLSGSSAPQAVDTAIKTPPMSNEKSNAGSKACPVVPNVANRRDISPPQSPSTVKGLSTSR
ncbi:hypothetical protein C2857_003131 [Epichloe festucae Fl1]|uniref:Uncharacterized protein n=1 Tax=Epichloe festucae (strain Fl1) TaxID=877507 RepID=A0A7S9PWL8_EPIFF|nr:hypothetical protein C2857_003131 [Epichloe festucae Fl1]